MFPKNLERPVLWSWFFQIPGTSGSLKNQRTTQHWFQQSQWRAHSQLITLCFVCEVSELRHSLSITIYRQISSRRQKIFLNETQGFDFHAMPITAPHLQVQKSNLPTNYPTILISRERWEILQAHWQSSHTHHQVCLNDTVSSCIKPQFPYLIYRFPQSLSIEKIWDCEAATGIINPIKSFQSEPLQARFWKQAEFREYNLLSSFHVLPELL